MSRFLAIVGFDESACKKSKFKYSLMFLKLSIITLWFHGVCTIFFIAGNQKLQIINVYEDL